jgi:type I restriction enzyme S subunit
VKAQQLKNSILQLAVQGKLVPQDPNDEPASVLLERIRAEKERLIKDGKAKNSKLLPLIAEDEIPFDVPESWELVRLDEVGIYRKGPFGSSLTKSMFVPKSDKSIKVYEQKNAIQKDSSIGDYYITRDYFESKMRGFEVFPGDVIVSCAGTIGETYIMPEVIEQGIINQALMRMQISKEICIEYFLLYFDYVLKRSAQGSSKGSAIKNIPPFEIFKMLVLPLPPLAKQHRIVERIEQLLPHIADYDTAEQKLTTLNAKFPDQLKKSILQFAVKGELVPQDENDAPASVLLERIRAEKEQLIQDGKLKKEKPLPPVTEGEIPFDVPEGWEWVRIAEMTIFQEGPGILAVDFRSSGVPLIRIAGMQGAEVSLDGCNYLDPEMVAKKWNHYRLDDGDVVISTSASMDKIAVVNQATVGAIPYTGLIRFKMLEALNREYFIIFIKSSIYINQIVEQMAGGMIKHYGPSHLKKMIIPLPPLAEQHRIVARCEELMALVERCKKASELRVGGGSTC